MGVPYLSASGADAGLGKLATYFALSMSYPQQSPMLVQLIRRLGKAKIGVLVADPPNLDVIDRYDPDFRPASHRYNGEEPSDLGLIAWGITKTIAVMLAATGADLSRQSLLTTIQSGREFASGVYAPVRYGPRSRFGARQSHLLEADCQARRFRTVAAFVSEL